MLHTYLPDNTIKLRFTSIFDDAAVPVITHDFNAKTLRLGPGYSILDENGDPLGAGGGGGGISGSGVANQIAYWTDTDEIGGDAGFTFDPTVGTLAMPRTDYNNDAPYPLLNLGPQSYVGGGNKAFYQFYAVNSELENGGNAYFASNFYGATDNGVAVGESIFGIWNYIEDFHNSGNLESLTGLLLSVIPGITGTATTGTVTGISIPAISGSGGAGVTTLTAIDIGNISGATDNYTIKTGAGDIVFGTLAGSGTRYVYVDDDGKLVAGAAV